MGAGREVLEGELASMDCGEGAVDGCVFFDREQSGGPQSTAVSDGLDEV